MVRRLNNQAPQSRAMYIFTNYPECDEQLTGTPGRAALAAGVSGGQRRLKFIGAPIGTVTLVG